MSSGGAAAAAAIAAQRRRNASAAQPVTYEPGQKIHSIKNISKDADDALWVLARREENFRKTQLILHFEQMDDHLARIFKNCTVHSTQYNAYLNRMDVVYTGTRSDEPPTKLRTETHFSGDILSTKITMALGALFLISVLLATFF